MKRAWLGAVVVLGSLLAGCDPDDFGGGGGGGGDVTFTEGFVFVRPDSASVDQLWIADKSDFTEVSKLTSEGAATNPALSADGRQIAYIEGSGDTTLLRTIATTVGASARTVLEPTGTLRNFRHPVFTPDGEAIVFAYDDGTSFSGIARVNTDGTGFQKLAGSASRSFASPSFFPNGDLYVAAGLNRGSYTAIDRLTLGSSVVAATEFATLGNEAQIITDRLVVSPDGTRAAFAGRVSTGVSRIFVADVSTKSIAQVTEHFGSDATTASDTYPTWVSDTELGFSASVQGGDSVYIIDAAPTSAGAGSLTVASAREPWYGTRTASTAAIVTQR